MNFLGVVSTNLRLDAFGDVRQCHVTLHDIPAVDPPEGC